MNLVIVGHIDHGKSTLIGRLLFDTKSLPKEKLEEIEASCKALGKEMEFAYVVDALEEERKNEMTIDTTQTFFQTEKREYVIIDTPGHKEFIKNMITGSSYADVAILIVDVSEGMKEQTKRHAYILKLLGIGQVIVVINKMDKVNYEKGRFDKIKEEVLNFLETIGVTPLCVIPISAFKGDNVVTKSINMKWYDGKTLVKVLDELEEKKRREYYFRLPIQDVYEINGEKIAVGNIISGEVKRGDKVKIYPSDEDAAVLKILESNKEIEMVRYPKSVGIALDKQIKRGDILAKGERPVVVQKLEANIFCIDKIEEGQEYSFACVTQEVEAKVVEIKEKINPDTLERESGKSLGEGDVGRVVLEFQNPVVIEKFGNVVELGRFVLKKNAIIIAGGTIR